MNEETKQLKISNFSDVEYEEPSFLVDPYFPIGKITLIQGDPGAGKTAFACKLAALVSTGGTLIDKPVMSGNVLLLSVEDDPSTLRGRIEGGGGDVSKCFFIEAAYDVTFLHEGLQDASKQTAAKLVVFDPIQAFLGADINMNMSNATRPILAYLAEVAREQECAIVLLAHMAKSRDNKVAALRSLGSVDIPGAARSVLHIGRDPARPAICIAAHVKSSNAKPGSAFSYSIGDKGAVTLGEYSRLTAYDLDVAAKRESECVPYDDEPLVKVFRQIMKENENIACIHYSSLTSIAARLLGLSPFSGGAQWNAAIKRLSREIYLRDRFVVTRDVRKIESGFTVFGETVESSGKQGRGVALYHGGKAYLDDLLKL